LCSDLKDIVDERAIFYNGEIQYTPVAKSDSKSIEILNDELYNKFIEGIEK